MFSGVLNAQKRRVRTLTRFLRFWRFLILIMNPNELLTALWGFGDLTEFMYPAYLKRENQLFSHKKVSVVVVW